MKKLELKFEGEETGAENVNEKPFWILIEKINKNIVSIPLVILLIIIGSGLYFIGPSILKDVHSSGVSVIEVVDSGIKINFEKGKGSFTLITVPANQYWVESEVELKANRTYKITATGRVSTGTAFGPKIEKSLNEWTCEDVFNWAKYRFDHKICLREPNGNLVHPEYKALNDSPIKLVQDFSDGMLIYNRKNCEYGGLLALALPDGIPISEVKNDPWKYRDFMCPIKKGSSKILLSVKQGSSTMKAEVEWKKARNQLVIKDEVVRLYFIVNDCAIPDVLLKEPKDKPEYTRIVGTYLFKNYKTMENLISDPDFPKLSGFLNDSFRLARELDENAQEYAKKHPDEEVIGARDLFFSNNQGHLTVVVEEN